MKIKVESEKCQGHGRCYALAPEIFHADSNGYIAPGDIEVKAELESVARRAVKACPERALTIDED